MRQEHFSNYPFNLSMMNRDAVYQCAEYMEWMKDSPAAAVHQYLRNRGYSREEINEAHTLFAMSQHGPKH